MAVIDLQSDSLGYAIKLAQVKAYELLYRMAGTDILSPGRMTALSLVSVEPGINQSTLAQRLNITRASVMKVVDALESMGLVTRDSIPGDRRSYALMLTPAGREQLQSLLLQMRRFEAEFASGLTAGERRQLLELLGKVVATEHAFEGPVPIDE